MSKMTPLSTKKPQSARSNKRSGPRNMEAKIAVISPRKRYMQNLIAKHKLTIPPIEEMVADQMKRGWKKLPTLTVSSNNQQRCVNNIRRDRVRQIIPNFRGFDDSRSV